MMFKALRKQKQAQPLPIFEQEAPNNSGPEAALITNYEELEDIQLTTNADILTETQKMNGVCPGFIAEDAQLYCIDRSDLDKHEALALNQLINLSRGVHHKEPVIRQTTRSVFESFINKNKDISLQQQTRESSNQVNELLSQAINNNATDIHLEINNNKTIVYQRIYGRLSTSQSFDKSQGIKIIAAIWNIYANQSFSNGDVAKDGRFNFDYKGQKWLCRVSYGYSKVTGERSLAIRLRDMKHIPDITTLGYHETQLKTFKQVSGNKGITLIIGAVNSGKSTTQTAIMKSRPALEKNLEVSDQIEVELDNFVQLQLPIEGTEEVIRENKERLRRISTRHDVDFIAINEIRDRETAAMASSMMLQGTTGIASIHGSGWVDAMNRLMSKTDLGISPDILFSESFLNLVIVQSLIGVLCERCRLQSHPDPFWRQHYQAGFGTAACENIRYHNNQGCSSCRYSGIRTLTLVAECIPIVEANRHLLMNMTNPQAMRDWMHENGVLNIHRHAYTKIINGELDPLMTQRKIGNFNKGNLYDAWHD